MNFLNLSITVIFLILLGFGIYVAFFRKRVVFSLQDTEMIRTRFADLDKKLHWDPRFVVMEGDKLLNFLFKKLGYKGMLGDSLKKAGRQFSNEQDLWRAHKLRNSLAHELGASVDIKTARAALKAYRSAFEQCGISFPSHE
ncbi:MAG: hypothetical protein NTX63_04505 [Candidatus Peregrinibacteria bacterium]|nr:hypothetical protein [Candidatus Peregrinibacteria bacterium]